MSVTRCDTQCCVAVVVHHCVSQHLHCRRVIAADRQSQARVTIVVGHVKGGVGSDESAEHRDVAILCSQGHGGIAVCIGDIHQDLSNSGVAVIESEG